MEFWKCGGCGKDVPEIVSKCMCGQVRPSQAQKGHFDCAVVGCKNAGTTTDGIRGSNTWFCRNHFGSDPKTSGYMPINTEKYWADEIVNERVRNDGMGRGTQETRSEYRARCIRSIKLNIKKIEEKSESIRG